MSERETRARSFEVGGDDYERFRPGFPAEAVRRALEGLGPDDGGLGDVLDLGAGTGKLTERLVSAARSVFAVDPSESMLAPLRAKLPSVTALVGPAEAIPLPNASVDAVTVGQAFHWFDRERAASEIHRVLRPGGALALFWNGAGREAAWDRRCQGLAQVGIDQDLMTAEDLVKTAAELAAAAAEQYADLPGFSLERSGLVEWTERITRADYLARWRTVSGLLVAPPDERDRRMAAIEAILDAEPTTAGRDVLDYPASTLFITLRREPGTTA